MLRLRVHSRGRRISLGDRAPSPAHDFLLMLDDRAAAAPVLRAAVIEAAALDPIALADLLSLYHGPDPSTARQTADTQRNQEVVVYGVERLHRRVANAL